MPTHALPSSYAANYEARWPEVNTSTSPTHCAPISTPAFVSVCRTGSRWVRNTGAMRADQYLEHLSADGEALLVAAQRAPGVSVPSCPAWDMSGLLAYTSAVHHWVAEIIRTRSQRRPTRQFGDEAPIEWVLLTAWYEQGLSTLVDLLGSLDVELRVWNWYDDGPAPAAFWQRRMALETTVHRWDAQDAAGAPEPIGAALAADGIDEYLGFVSGEIGQRPVPGFSGSLALIATDIDCAWTLTLAPDRLQCRPGREDTDAVVQGPASALFLWTLNRSASGLSDLEVSGDPAVARAWSAISFD